ncbi:hypothetical protein L3Y34_002221 [Caenorhabditis briggsae]|uniref:Uncharacterized protein n=1 Tax=Caenorhabditis briggsae TaxID=6238 RepID=A0AAE9DEW6_CAEBR|nr:hypothetical protein L3Y34_002221 [Caenorhabditis briggsae]
MSGRKIKTEIVEIKREPEPEPDIDVRGKECLEQATITRHLLKANSTNYNSALTAIAELVDNSYDANATKVLISLENKFPNNQIRICDNGTGLSRQEVLNIIKLGFSQKEKEAIGRYGTGLKSAAFHLGKKVLLLTKKDGIYTAFFMAWNNLENQNDESMLVATPSYNGSTGEKYCPEPEDERIHDYEIRIISENMDLNENVFDEFLRIPSEHGTLIIIKDLHRMNVGYEQILDTSIDKDIRVEGEDLPPHKVSLVEYLKVLYLYPKAFFYVEQTLQTPRKILSTWVGRCYANVAAYETEALKIATEELKREVENLDDEFKRLQSENAQENIREMPKEEREISKNRLDLAMATVLAKKREVESRIKYNQNIGIHKIPFEFGLEVSDRQSNGIHFYANNRLILYGYKSPFFEKFSNTIGISMYCNLDANIFPPTQNKQNFLYDKDFNSVVRLCDKSLNQYFRYLTDVWVPRHLKNQWGRDVKDKGEDEKTPDDAKRTAIIEKECGVWKACALCHKWKRIRNKDDYMPIRGLQFVCQMVKNQKCNANKDPSDGHLAIELPQLSAAAIKNKEVPSKARNTRSMPTCREVRRSEQPKPEHLIGTSSNVTSTTRSSRRERDSQLGSNLNQQERSPDSSRFRTRQQEEPRRDSQRGLSSTRRQESEEQESGSEESVILSAKKEKKERRSESVQQNRESSRKSQVRARVVEKEEAIDNDWEESTTDDLPTESRSYGRARRQEMDSRRRRTDEDVELVPVKKERAGPEVTTTGSAEASAAVALEKVLRALGVDPTPQLNVTRVIIDKIQKPRQARRRLRADATKMLEHLGKNKRHRVNMRAINKEKTTRAKLESFVNQIR